MLGFGTVAPPTAEELAERAAADKVRRIAKEVTDGLKNETGRICAAQANVDFYHAEFEAHMPTLPGPDGAYEPPENPRVVPLMQRTVNVLGQDLYATGPAREFADDPELTAWLQDLYSRGGVSSLIQEADRLALAARAAAIEVVGTNDPDRPVRFRVWSAAEFVVWVDPDDPERADAVATLDVFDERRRLRLWTAEWLVTFETDKLLPLQTTGGTAFRVVDQRPNHYGCVPFAFVHARRPAGNFWANGPGDALRTCNEYVNAHLTLSGATVEYGLMPIVEAHGTDTPPPKPMGPGVIWHVQPSAFDSSGPIKPELRYLQPDLAGIEVSWNDIKDYVSLTLQLLGVPDAVVRMVETMAKSGTAMALEQLPLVTWAKGRQSTFAEYERALAGVVIRVAAAEYARLGEVPPVALDPADARYMSLRWPSMTPETPVSGAEQAQQDRNDLDIGMTSRVRIAMKRFSMSQEEAQAYLKSIDDDRAWEDKNLRPIARKPAPPAITPQPETDNGQRAEESGE